MRTANDILRFKGTTIWSVAPTDTVLHALTVMAEHEIGSVLVLEKKELVGVMTERDYARKVVLMGRSSRDLPIAEVMTKELVCVTPDETIDTCMGLMTDRRVRHLPVVSDDGVVGLVSIGDLVRARIAEQEQTIEYLQTYIAG